MNCSTAISIVRTATATTATNGINCGTINGGIIMNLKSNSTMNSVPIAITSNNSNARNLASSSTMTKNPEEAAKIIEQSDVICFDVDSTVICEEGIDELAKFCGKGDEVARITREAMGGAMTFRDALTIRLNTIRPRQQQIMDFVRERPSKLTRNVQRFIEELRKAGKDVYLVSGGFDCLIAPVAQILGIPMERVYANRLIFRPEDGAYVDFDRTQPTSQSGGKADAIALIREKHPDADIVTMIGDGATDLEAVPPATHFIGFGGNVVRAEVFRRAQYYVTDFEQLMKMLPVKPLSV